MDEQGTDSRVNKIPGKWKFIHFSSSNVEKLLVDSYKIYLLESANPKMSIN